jgi:perosamine synthetase
MRGITPIPHSRPWITNQDQCAVATALASGMISQGESVLRFEQSVAQYVGVKHAIAQSSGTASLVLALKLLGLGKGDNVALPTYVCRSVLEAIYAVDAVPLFTDVNEYGVVTPEILERVINSKTKAIIAVHIFGNPCNIQKLRCFHLPIIEDACQAFGLIINGSQAGSLGDIGILSFHATKCLTTGEGGMLVTNHDYYACIARQDTLGSKTLIARQGNRLCDLQAALGLSQLQRYSIFLERRQFLLTRLLYAVNELGLSVRVHPNTNAPFRFTVKSMKRFDEVATALRMNGIIARQGVDELLHRYTRLDDRCFPSAVDIFRTTISIPFYPALSDTDVDRIIESLPLL